MHAGIQTTEWQTELPAWRSETPPLNTHSHTQQWFNNHSLCPQWTFPVEYFLTISTHWRQFVTMGTAHGRWDALSPSQRPSRIMCWSEIMFMSRCHVLWRKRTRLRVCFLQVSVTNSRGEELCGGVLLDRFSVLTAASCLLLNSNREPNNFYVVPGTELNTTNQKYFFWVDFLFWMILFWSLFF